MSNQFDGLTECGVFADMKLQRYDSDGDIGHYPHDAGDWYNADKVDAMHPVTGSKVVLTIAHLDHTPENCDDENLRAWCQRCHLTYDAPMKAARRKAKKKLFEPRHK